MVTEYIFVYGSLRKGFSSPAREVLDDYAEFAGRATFQGKLYKIDWYPGVVPSRNRDDVVHGEVYLINDRDEVLSKLDRYEGCSPSDPKPHAFVRKQMPVNLKGKEMTAWVYLFNLPVDDKNQIRSGDYLKYEE